jgi:hypothetical protein
MPSPPIGVYLTTIASQPALRQRQGKPYLKGMETTLVILMRCRIYPTNLASKEDTFHFL